MSKPVMCIVIDGWHKGHTIIMPDIRQEIHLIRPRTVTIDDCCYGEKVADIASGKETYRLAFGSVDGETALYSTDGGSKQFWNMKEWVGYGKDHPNWAEQVLYVGIHDPRASINFESLES